jgi:hypothetical protein
MPGELPVHELHRGFDLMLRIRRAKRHRGLEMLDNERKNFGYDLLLCAYSTHAATKAQSNQTAC